METRQQPSGKQSLLSGTRTRLALACACAAVVTFGAGASAQAQNLVFPLTADLSHPWTVPVDTPPDHFTADHRRFDMDVVGLRAYAETIKSSDPKLYAQLAPDVARLESSARTSEQVALAGAGAGVAVFLACDTTNKDQTMGCGLAGLASMGVVGLVAMAFSPGRQDIFDVLRKAGAGVSF